MRRTAVAAALALLLTGCGGGSEDPEVPEQGPLRLSMQDKGCRSLPDGASVTVLLTMDNTGEIPLTIDEVALVAAENVTLHDSTSRNEPAVDTTLAEKGLDAAQRPLLLVLRKPDPEAPMSVDEVAVDYHNVDGRFRASMPTSTEVTTEACPPSAP